MKATSRGLILNKPELIALLAFAGKGVLAQVTFQVTTGPLGELSAYATNSRAAVLGCSNEVFSQAKAGTWLVCTRFLKQVAVNVPKDGRALLLIDGQNLFSAEVFIAGEEPDADLFADDDLAEPMPTASVTTISWTDNAVLVQPDLPGIDLLSETLKNEPMGDYSAASRIEISTASVSLTRHLSAVTLLDSVVMWPGREAGDVVRFVAKALDGTTTWMASVLPPSRWTGEDDDETERPVGKGQEPKQTKQVSMFGDAPPRSPADLASALADEVEKLPGGCSLKVRLGDKTVELAAKDAPAIRAKAEASRKVDLSKRVKKPAKAAKVADLAAERAKRSSKKGGK